MIEKRTLSFLLLVLFGLAAALPQPADATVLVRVGIYQNEPLVFRDANGHPAGFYIDILETVAAMEGWELKFVECSFSDCLTLLERGEIDLMTAIAYSQARAERFSFNQETVLSNWGQLYARNDTIQSLLDLEALTIAVVRDDIYYAGLQSILETLDVSCQFLELNDYAQVLHAIETGQADAGLITRLYGLQHARNYDVVRSPILCCPVSLRFAAPKGKSDALLATLDRHLQEMKAEPNSSYYRALDRWFASVIEQPLLLERVPPWLTWTVLSISALAILGIGGNLLLRAQVRARTAELSASERRYRELFENVPIGLYRSTPDGRLLDVNAALVDALGYPSREALLQTPVQELYDDPEQRSQALRRVDEMGTTQGVLLRLRRFDGTSLWVRDYVRAITDAQGQVIRYEGALEDVTSQVKLQRTLQAQVAQQATLASLSLQGLSQQDLTAFLQEATALIAKTLGVTHCKILQYEKRNSTLRLVAGVGWKAGTVGATILNEDETTLADYTFQQQEPVVTEDFHTETRFRPPQLLVEHGIRCGINVTIGEPDRPWGLLGVYDVVPRTFSAEALNFVQVAANIIGQAAIHRQAQDALRRHTRNLEALREINLEIASQLDLDRLLPLILDRAVKLVEGKGGDLYLYRPEKEVLELVATSGRHSRSLVGTTLRRGEGLVGRVWERNEPIAVEDYHQWEGQVALFVTQSTRAVVGVPVSWGDTFLGVLAVRADQPGIFTATDVDLVRLFAAQVAVALHNARLFARLSRDREELTLLHQFGQRLSGSLDLTTIARRAIEDLCEAVGARGGLLFTSLTDDPYRLHLEAFVGHDPQAAAALGRELEARPSGEALITWVSTQRRSAIVPDTSLDPRWRPYPGLDDWARSALSVPLLSRDRTVGVLILTSDQPDAFNEEHRQLVESAAAMVATALVNAQLYQETRERALTEETLRQAALALSVVRHPDEAIERILAELEKVVPYDSASVQRLEGNLLRIIGGRGFPNLDALIGVSFDVTRTDNPNRQVVQTQRSFIVDDAPQYYEEFKRHPHVEAHIRAWLGVPMMVGDRIIGMIALDKREPGFYTEEHARLAEAFAAQAAIALENARLYQAEREQRELAEALAEAAAIVGSTLDLDQVLDLILDQVQRVVHGDTFNIMLVEGNRARIVRARGYEKILPEPIAIGEQASPIDLFPTLQEMIQHGTAVCVSDTTRDPKWVKLPGRNWQHSYVGAPIRIRGKTVGFLNVNGRRAGQFGPQDAHRLQTFADHVATALENARLYHELERYAEELEARVAARTAELEAERARLEAILDSTGDGIVVTDAQGAITRTNRVAERWLEHDLSPTDAAALRQAIVECVRRATEHPETMLELTGLDLELVAAPIIYSEGDRSDSSGVVVAIHDITHLRALDRMKTKFISNVSHELRTPATSILLYTHLLRTGPTEKAPVYLEALEKEAQHQAQLIENILELSRIDAGRLDLSLQVVALNSVIAEAVSAQRQVAIQRGVSLVFTPCEPSPQVSVDVQRLRQVVDNLLVNALHYTPKRGRVTISTHQTRADGRDWAVLTVQDTGIGIPEHELPHIFERFYRGEAPQRQQISGTGLGLPIAKEIVEMHGGRITVESSEGKGSTFTVWLPVEHAGESVTR